MGGFQKLLISYALIGATIALCHNSEIGPKLKSKLKESCNQNHMCCQAIQLLTPAPYFHSQLWVTGWETMESDLHDNLYIDKQIFLFVCHWKPLHDNYNHRHFSVYGIQHRDEHGCFRNFYLKVSVKNKWSKAKKKGKMFVCANINNFLVVYGAVNWWRIWRAIR